jgi:hypothetical protein
MVNKCWFNHPKKVGKNSDWTIQKWWKHDGFSLSAVVKKNQDSPLETPAPGLPEQLVQLDRDSWWLDANTDGNLNLPLMGILYWDTLLAIFPESSVWAFIVFSAGMIWWSCCLFSMRYGVTLVKPQDFSQPTCVVNGVSEAAKLGCVFFVKGYLQRNSDRSFLDPDLRL